MSPGPARRWLHVAAVYAVILVLSAVPGEALEDKPGWTAVVGHALGYGLLAVTIHRAWDGVGAGAVAILLAVVLGVVNELQQGLVPGRSPDVADVGVDGLGALAGVWWRGGWAVSRRRRPGSRPPARGCAGRR